MEFKYKTRVRVTSGFYEGTTGALEEFAERFLEDTKNYLVQVDGRAAKFIWVSEKDLEIIENKKEEDNGNKAIEG